MMDIKDYRKTEIPMLLIGCTLILFLISGELQDIFEDWYTFLSSAFLGSIVSIFVYIGDGLISTKQKDAVIYLWRHIPQPGETVFERILKKGDKRFSPEDVRERYGKGIDDIINLSCSKERHQKENAIWYQASDRVKDVTKVLASHRDYLMSRDMFFAVFEYLILYLVFCVLMKYAISKRFIIILILIMVAIRIGIKNKATAFVDNVIAVDISQWKNNKGKNKS